MGGSHYQTLGVSPDATVDEIRAAYRELARKYHPDVARDDRDASAPTMTAINRAWFVLGDAARRAVYDAEIAPRRVTSSTASSSVASSSTLANLRVDDGPARFPWRFILALIGLATAGILVMGILGGDTEPTPVDRVVQVGSCVQVDRNLLEAIEVDCGDPHDGVVVELVPFDAVCPSGTEGFRDRQGMGRVCLES